jgi:Na+-transporting NADH:ubiquinone oxidoreductase subunit NqrB
MGWFVRDPRHYQIAVLGSLLLYGMIALDFQITPARAALILSTVLATQLLFSKLFRLPRFDPKSALISGASLCLLLRTNSDLVAILVAVLTIASKFLVRVRGKHVFNPTNLGLVLGMLITGQVWVSPGQWGNAVLFAALMAMAGGMVVSRALRSDVTLAFLAAYLGLVFARSLWLGEPLTIPTHRLESGALLLFAFFMISDPKTTPSARSGRILFAAVVAFGAAYVQFRMFRTNGPLWALALFSPLVPLLDLLLPGPRYDWSDPKGSSHDPKLDLDRSGAEQPALVPSRDGVLRVLRREG